MTASNDSDPVILVDADDREIGTAPKLDAHRQGLRHRAISALVRNSAGQFLLQRRAAAKYHSGGLWTNACCSHPLPGESVAAAAERRLQQEMGVSCPLQFLFVYRYNTPVPGGLIENEVVHVFGGSHDGPVEPDPGEVGETKWVTHAELMADVRARPDAYTVWFRKYLDDHGGQIAEWLAAEKITMTAKVLLIHFDVQDYLDRLVPRFPTVEFHGVHHGAEAKPVIADIEVVMGLGHHIPNDLLALAPKLKWVQALTTGTETLTAPGVLPKDVILTSTRGIHGPQMSELAFLNMMALARDFRRMQRSQAEGKWDQWNQPILHGKTLVIVGLGLLAEHLAERAKLFGMEVIGVSGGRSSAPHFDEVVSRDALVKVAARADFLLLLVPYSPDTRHMIGREVLAAMKPTAFLINLARGGVLDEAALIDHLRAGKIAGAGLDVFSTQPLPPDSPLWRMPNVIITPNVGGRSNVFVDQTLTVIEPNLRAWLDGRPNDLRNVVPH